MSKYPVVFPDVMENLNKKHWLEGLFLGAINSTLVIENKEKRYEHALQVSEQFAKIILEQFNDKNWD